MRQRRLSGRLERHPAGKAHPLLAFVCKIVRNVSLKRYEQKTAAKRNSHYDAVLEELEDCLPSPTTVEDEAEARELTRAIEAFLDTLPRENRVIFLRRYWFSDTYAHIAAQVGLTAKNVSVRLSRIRKELRAFLMEREVL